MKMTNENLKEQIEMALKATNSNDVYCIGMRNALRWVLSCITEEEPHFENCKTINCDLLERLTSQ